MHVDHYYGHGLGLILTLCTVYCAKCVIQADLNQHDFLCYTKCNHF